jgi:hypothetical protein
MCAITCGFVSQIRWKSGFARSAAVRGHSRHGPGHDRGRKANRGQVRRRTLLGAPPQRRPGGVVQRYYHCKYIACQILLTVVFVEEELKRLQRELNQKEFGAVQYNYDENSQQSSANSDTNKEEEEDDTPFVAPTELDIPVNMVLVCQNFDETI